MKLTEFYALNENSHFTLEPEGNAKGRLLSWTEEFGDIDIGYQVIASGDIEKLISALRELTQITPDQEEEIRILYVQAIEDGGLAVTYSDETGANVTDKQGAGDSSDYDPVDDFGF